MMRRHDSSHGPRMGSFLGRVVPSLALVGSLAPLHAALAADPVPLHFTFNYEYSAVDSASNDESGIKSYQIVEIENGKRTLVTGSSSSDRERLQIIEKLDRDSAKYASTVVM